ncbi:phospholipase D-like domain-containing protein [Aurantiacibacter sp. MUD61]|uniref:phospholipase D-like domain-containing protein n=1 Tax=Aurantiacibacter sp. MUD61 TaxID=3009083 RepID=UPI0022F01D98|nr:phosphatidylserine/phosphatidylglycerophosphate/cardiolipin synthase family protein [Aurantiacibacter sp. MUD61]
MYTEPDASAHDFPEPFTVEAQGHSFTFMPDGVHRYAALLACINDAKNKLEVFYYMFQDDPAGRPVRDALVAAAERGVDVKLVVDRFGTDADEEFFQPIVDAGGSFCFFNPKTTRRYLIRNHQKMCIADEEMAIVGGFNISENYFKPPEENGWTDLGVIMRGPCVEKLREWYKLVRDWAKNDKAQYRAVRDMVREWEPGDGKVRLLVGGPTRVPSNWEYFIKRDFNDGKKLHMVMAYFSPPRSYRRLLRKFAQRGDVNLVMAAKSDNSATIAAARATYSKLLKAGAKIYEFQPSKLHMKLLVVDDVTYFGSSNFDHRSIRLNLEMMFRVEDQELADRMREFIGSMQDASEHITPELHRERSNPWERFKRWIGWSLVSIVDYTVTRRLNP